MLTTMKTGLTAAALLAMTSFGANATSITGTDAAPIDVFVGADVTAVGTLVPGGTITFDFNILDDLRVVDIAVAATGTNGGTDLVNVTFERDVPDTGLLSFSTIGGTGLDNTAGAAFDFIDGAIYSAGDTFTLTFNDGIQDAVGVTLSFETVALAAVPLPASGMMLLGGLVAAGAVARRRKKADA